MNGKLRDAASLHKENWPIWCTGYTPIGCFNKKPLLPVDNSLVEKHFNMYEGTIAVCDDCGVVIIPKDKINDELLKDLNDIENQEDIWFDRLDHYKENTFDIVCKKQYLNDVLYMNRRNP